MEHMVENKILLIVLAIVFSLTVSACGFYKDNSKSSSSVNVVSTPVPSAYGRGTYGSSKFNN